MKSVEKHIVIVYNCYPFGPMWKYGQNYSLHFVDAISTLYSTVSRINLYEAPYLYALVFRDSIFHTRYVETWDANLSNVILLLEIVKSS